MAGWLSLSAIVMLCSGCTQSFVCEDIVSDGPKAKPPSEDAADAKSEDSTAVPDAIASIRGEEPEPWYPDRPLSYWVRHIADLEGAQREQVVPGARLDRGTQMFVFGRVLHALTRASNSARRPRGPGSDR